MPPVLQPKYGNTALMNSSSWGHTDIATLLIEAVRLRWLRVPTRHHTPHTPLTQPHTTTHHHTSLRTAALYTATYRYILSSLRIPQTRSLTTRFPRHSPHTAPHAAGSFRESHRHDEGRRVHVTHDGVRQRPRGRRTGFDRGRPFAEEAHPDEGTWVLCLRSSRG